VFARSGWGTLRSTWVEPPFAAVVGDRIGIGTTPTDDALIAAIRARGSSR
jgi:hypothetical protein